MLTVIVYGICARAEFKGQARIIIPGQTACYECSTDTLVKEEDPTHVSCTIASTPRNAGHCIQYAALVMWPVEFPGTPCSLRKICV